MRKPVAVVVVALVFILFVSLARQLAEPAISGSGAQSISSVPELQSAPPAPVFPAANHVVKTSDHSAIADVTSKNKQIRKSRKIIEVRNRAAASRMSGRNVERAEPESADLGVYSALLGEVEHSVRRVRDYGARGIGTPQWIESLSGRKTLVPVRDFSGSAEVRPAERSTGIIVPVATDTSFAQ